GRRLFLPAPPGIHHDRPKLPFPTLSRRTRSGRLGWGRLVCYRSENSHDARHEARRSCRRSPQTERVVAGCPRLLAPDAPFVPTGSPSRAPFSGWGGTGSPSRAPFSGWGGAGSPSRAPFSGWGGVALRCARHILGAQIRPSLIRAVSKCLPRVV